jgi:hypothetical protein
MCSRDATLFKIGFEKFLQPNFYEIYILGENKAHEILDFWKKFTKLTMSPSNFQLGQYPLKLTNNCQCPSRSTKIQN